MTMPPLPLGAVYTPALGTVGAAMYTYTADQMRDYANKCVASERDFWRVEGDKWRDQMREYGAACAAAERERCALLCESKAVKLSKLRETEWIDAYLECAAAIRRAE